MNQRAMFTCPPRALHISVYLVLLVLGSTALSGGVPASRQMTDVFSFADFSNVGSAWLERNENGVTAKVSVRGTDEGVYTMWWVIWNNPENCITPFACGANDLVKP